MTRTAPKLTNELFPDWKRVLSRAARVETETVRHCEVCGSSEAAMRRMVNTDGWKCEAEADCGRRAWKSGRIV